MDTPFARVATVVVIFGLIELMIGCAWLVLNMAENCNNGISRVECSGTLKTGLAVAFFVVPVAAIVLAGQAAREGSEDA